MSKIDERSVMKYLVIIFMLFCGVAQAEWVYCPVCDAEYKKGEDERCHGIGNWCDSGVKSYDEQMILNNGMGANNGTHQLERDHIVLVRRLKKIDDKVADIKESIDQMYSMICDLETKFMGNDRMKQITNPDHISEAVRQEIWKKKQIEELKKRTTPGWKLVK